MDQKGLREAGNPLNDRVAPAKNRDQDLIQNLVLTHNDLVDLFNDALKAFGAVVQRVVIVRVEDDVFYARLFIEAENEINEKLIVELDARPSDSIALAVRQQAPLYVIQDVWDGLKDMTSALEELRDKGMELEGGD